MEDARNARELLFQNLEHGGGKGVQKYQNQSM
jgi:hypothetical protein